MKKLMFLLSFMILFCSQAKALTFEQAINQNKPVVLLIYATWADGLNEMNAQFDDLQIKNSDKYNFVKLDIASKDAKSFNQRFSIYPNLPYIILFKNNGKIVRNLTKACIMDTACFQEKLNFFAN